MSDTDFAQGAEQGGFDPMAQAFAEGKPMERQERETAVPKGTYVVEFKGGKGAHQGDENIPVVRISAQVEEGVEGTEGRMVFAPLKLRPSRFKFVKTESGNRQPVPMDDDEYREACKTLADTILRVQKVLGLLGSAPTGTNATDEALTEYASQFAGKKAVIDVSYLPARDDFDASNYFVWGSIAALDEPVYHKDGKEKGKVRGSALDVAREEIKKAAERKAKRDAKGKGKTAAGFVGGGPTGF